MASIEVGNPSSFDGSTLGFKEIENSDILYCKIMWNIMKNPPFLLLQLMVFKLYGKMSTGHWPKLLRTLFQSYSQGLLKQLSYRSYVIYTETVIGYFFKDFCCCPKFENLRPV